MDLRSSSSIDSYAAGQPQQVSRLSRNSSAPYSILLLSLVLVGALFLLQGNIDLNLADEGFLWYGAVQTARGHIPLIDFQGYDPGRYYWIAPWLALFGQDIMALRLAVALFQVVGLTFGLLAAKRVVTQGWLLAIVGVVLLAWMFPRHKLFEPSLAMAAVYFAVRLIEKPTPRQYVCAGIFVGLAAFFGRNHGFYSFSAFFLLILFLWFKFRDKLVPKKVSLWLAGVVIGYTPMWLMLALVPDMFARFTYLADLLFRQQSTNLPLPVPWPWTIDYAQADLLGNASKFFTGLLFLLLPVFYLISAAAILQMNKKDIQNRSLLIASTWVGIFYMHYAFSRAELWHLAQSIHPFLLGLVALPPAFNYSIHRKAVGIGLIILALAASLTLVMPASPYWQKLTAKDQFVLYNVTGRQLWLRQEQAAYLETVKQLITQHVGPQEELLIAPHSPGLYPILQRQAPTWDIYLLFPETEERQQEIIQDLNHHHVNWVILADNPLDGRDDLRFRNTHPLVWQYFLTKFEPVDAPGLPGNQQLLHRKAQ